MKIKAQIWGPKERAHTQPQAYTSWAGIERRDQINNSMHCKSQCLPNPVPPQWADGECGLKCA